MHPARIRQSSSRNTKCTRVLPNKLAFALGRLMTAMHQLLRVPRELLFAHMSDAFYFYTTNYNKHSYSTHMHVLALF